MDACGVSVCVSALATSRPHVATPRPVPRPLQDDLADATKAFLAASDSHSPCLGKMLYDLAEDGRAKLGRKPFRKALTKLGAQLNDEDEAALHECLDVKGDGVAAEVPPEPFCTLLPKAPAWPLLIAPPPRPTTPLPCPAPSAGPFAVPHVPGAGGG